MSIEHDNGSVTIFIGDADVLIGMTALRGVVRVWFARLPSNHGLTIGEPTLRPNTEPPANTAVMLYFVDRKSMEAYLDTLEILMREAFYEDRAY
ncbi:MAG: hypothetical protein L0241_30780 [Planctomycetia bacterium]|nr:hypothetical protein [Planctomycetia bacterium]